MFCSIIKWLQIHYEKIKIFIKETWLLIFWITSISLLILFISDIYYKFFYFLDRLPNKNNSGLMIDAFHAIEITILTFVLVVVAWRQLSSLNKTGTADFLMRIDDRFGSNHIVKARIYLHEIYCEVRPNCTHQTHSLCKECREKHMQDIRKKIQSIRHNIKLSKEFVQLRNLLELFETIGFFVNKNHLTFRDVNELVGGTVEFHYQVFMDWIHYLQDNKDSGSFTEFERLVYNIKSSLIPEDRRNRYKKH